MIKVRRNGKEIFSVTGNRPVLNFPHNTRIDCIEQDSMDFTVVLAETPADADVQMVISAERSLIRHGRTIEAIKSYRERTGLGLKDSKDAIDRENETMRARGEYFPER